MYKQINIREFRNLKNIKLNFGRRITIISGRNSTGKSLLLGMVANSGELKTTEAKTYISKQFRAEFGEIFKASEDFDKSQSNLFEIILCDDNNNEIAKSTYRSSWQTKRNKEKEILGKRFRIIPKTNNFKNDKNEGKFSCPIIYLGLSRLFPVGESKDINIKNRKVVFKNKEDETWFQTNYCSILSINDKIKNVTNYSIGETDKKQGIGINTEKYDYLTNSSGQDNLGQILLAILSFKDYKQNHIKDFKSGMLLIDEFDATLHPAAQNRLFNLLLHESKQNNYQVLITTHSLSLLEEICYKTYHNTKDENSNNDIESYYFSFANRELEVLRNPQFETIRNELMVTSSIQSNYKIKIIVEDEEAKWFLTNLISDLEPLNINIIPLCTSYSDILKISKSSIELAKEFIYIVDGDVANKEIDDILEEFPDNKFLSLFKLPGNKRPEQIIYDYILSCPKEDDLWRDLRNVSFDFTWQYFQDHNPSKSDDGKTKERERHKTFFKKHKCIYDKANVMKHWINDNQKEFIQFINNFKESYNKKAERMFIAKIK